MCKLLAQVEIFLESYRAEYLRRLDLDFCLELAKSNKALARFLYAHILKRLGSNPMYIRNFSGFLNDVGLEHLTQLATKNRNQKVKETLHPALDLVRGKAFSHYELDDQKNIVFFSKPV